MESHVDGVIVMRPSRTASIAGFASGSIFTNHWRETIGSTIVPHFAQKPTEFL